VNRTRESAVADTRARLSVPDPFPVIDGLLAATVAVRDWPLVTGNTLTSSDAAFASARPRR
jgi:predicted nucleic acid-binding protein